MDRGSIEIATITAIYEFSEFCLKAYLEMEYTCTYAGIYMYRYMYYVVGHVSCASKQLYEVQNRGSYCNCLYMWEIITCHQKWQVPLS